MVARAKCEYFSRCNLLSDDTLVTGRTNTLLGSNQLATCIAQQTNDSTCQVGQMAINLGRLSFNDAAFTACMTALYPAGSCVRDLNAIAALCKTKVLVTGTGSVGAACTSDFECTGSYCAIAQGSVCGVCTAWANVDGGVGSRCSKDSMCDPTRSYCPGSDGNPPQNNTTCATYKGLDAGCNGSQTEIAQQEECGPGNVCAGGLFGGPNRCIVGKLEGAACTKNQLECARSGRTSTELTCATTGPTTSVCTKVFNTTAGGNCGTGEATSLTQAAPPYCLESEFCSQNVCTPRRAMNQACTDTTQCQAGLRCTGNFGNRFCLPYADVGANCQQTNECRGLLSCVNNSCVASLAPLGSPCSLQNNSVPQCAEGYCEGNGSAIGTCTALKADGQTCARNNQCQSYSCVNGMCAHACWQP